MLVVRETPEAEPRGWASSDLEADLPTRLRQVAARWAIEGLFSDTKDLLGLDQYQLLSATARLRFWTLVLAAYAFLDEERARLHQQTTGHVTLGEARRAVQRRHQDALVAWICDQQDGGQSAATLAAFLAA